MKIAMMGQKSVPSRAGGVEVVVTELAKRMTALGHTVVCYNRMGHYAGQIAEEQVPSGMQLRRVLTIPVKGLAAVSASLFASVRAAWSDCDVVHVHTEGQAAFCFLPKMRGKRVIVTIHGLNWQCDTWKKGFGAGWMKLGERMAVRCADEIVVLQKELEAYFLRQYGRKTTLLPNGRTEKKTVVAKEILSMGLQVGEYFLFSGRVVPEKGLEELIRAFCQTKTSKKLVIVGDCTAAPKYVQQLRTLAAADSRVMLTGFVPATVLQELYQHAYAFVMASHTEGMPLALLEAMCYGCCCLTSDIAGCTSVLQGAGETFRMGDACDLQQKLTLLDTHPERVAAYRRQALMQIAQHPSWDWVTEQTLRLYAGERINEDVSVAEK